MKSKQTKGLNRNTIDKYYTKHSVVELCLNYVKEYIKIDNNDLIIEPSAGNGSFISSIENRYCSSVFVILYVFLDLFTFEFNFFIICRVA
jgi:hypothetical protein